MRPYLLFYLCLVLALASCAKEKDSSLQSGVTNPIFSLSVKNLNEAQEKAKAATLSCDLNGLCDPSVGLVSLTTDTAAAQCTGFLVGSDTVATNSHCIPEDIRSAGASCAGRLWMNFAADAKHPEYERQIDCSQILYASVKSDNSSVPDYAYFRLSRPSRRPALTLSRLGFAQNAAYSVHKVDPIDPGQTEIKGLQSQMSCQALYHTVFLPSFFHPLAPVASLTGCQVVRGNSGSPVLAADGSVRGVVFGFLDPDKIASSIEHSIFVLDDGMAPLNLASNYACLQGPDGSQGPGSCGQSDALNHQEQAAEAASEQQQVDSALLARIAGKTDAFFQDFQWTAGIDSLKTVFPVPACVKAQAVARYAKPVALRLPEWKLEPHLDHFFQVRYELGQEEFQADENLVLSPVADGRFQADLTGDTTDSRTIPLCQ